MTIDRIALKPDEVLSTVSGHPKGGTEPRDAAKSPKDWALVRLKNVISYLEAGVSVNSSSSPNEFDLYNFFILKTSTITDGKFIPSESKPIIVQDQYRAKVNPEAGSLFN